VFPQLAGGAVQIAPAPAPAVKRAIRGRPMIPAPVVRDTDGESNSSAPAEPRPLDLKPGEIAVTVHFRDGGSMRMKLRAKTIPIVTAYGKLDVPAEDIQGIELAPRLPDDVTRKVKDAIARLGSDKPDERSAAGPELFNLKEKAYIALVRASHSRDKDLAKRAGDLVDDLRGLVPNELLEAHIQDTIETEDSRFAGDVPLASLEATSPQFGNVELKLSDMQSATFESKTRPIELRGGNPNLTQFERQVGKTFSVRVTGAMNRGIWGTGPYTTHSSLASAAVHAGVLRQGQTGTVRVRIVREQDFFNGSFQNGVSSQPWQGTHGAFVFVR